MVAEGVVADPGREAVVAMAQVAVMVLEAEVTGPAVKVEVVVVNNNCRV